MPIFLSVLRTSEQKNIFNGENEISESGSYEAAGATFDYHRIDGVQQGEGVTEWITCTGPIKDPVELLVCTSRGPRYIVSWLTYIHFFFAIRFTAIY